MRHKKIKGRLNRRSSWRKSTLQCLARDLFKYQRIRTTLAKAKALRSFAEPLITTAKKDPDSVNARRKVYKELSNREAVQILFNDLAPLYKDVNGGYTRIMRLKHRKGDGAQIAVMELTRRTLPDDQLLGPGYKEQGEDKTSLKKAKKKKNKSHAAPEADQSDIQKREEKRKQMQAEKEHRQAKEHDKGKGFFGKFRRGDR